MYDFTDTNNNGSSKTILPSEAMSFNGVFLENIIPGYRTLNVVGRELAATEIQSYQLGIRDGMRQVYSRIPERELIVKYKIDAPTNEDFRDRFNRLNVALFSEKDVEIWFNDEPEMLWSGSKSDVDNVPEGVNHAVGTFTVSLSDPYKYTRSDATSVTWGSKVITFQSNYLMGNTGSGAANMPILIEGGAYWGSTMITFQNRSYLMGDDGKESKPIEIYPTVEGLKVKPEIFLKGTGRGVWIKTRNDTIDLGDFDNAEILIDTQKFYITKNGQPMIRPMNDFYIYPNEPLYIQAKDSDFALTIRYPNRFL
ncbi:MULTISPECIES: distal tail protein Dit [Enterococcus]|jgi:predicted phage tail component-like protein|uniref:Phage protein n=2 Tax=Enterococcus TaxID=1350 RepID=R2QZ45_9ENTE|nr:MULTISPECIES: distal tail protein Dit [Enterococcus]EOI00671.1 phage protein [Enterococcus moraviensis ATCC BAA-383]EOT73100.1 phage protein [Enterococcus moraviensis ATCC BAA-383]OJG68658.1 phage protein [Enterococcus moraviensis]GGC75012.1 tail protein [Enterococcus wangshanyuanii]